MKLVGINGFKRSGKNTTYEMIQSIAQDKYVAGVGFADKLKVMAARALGHLDLSDGEAIALMDIFKERGCVESFRTYPRFEKNERGEWLPENIPTKRLSGREYLQLFGGEARKVFGDTFWIDQVLPEPVWQTDLILRERIQDDDANRANLQARYAGVDILCITDCRYENEAQRIRDLGGVVLEVVRPGLESDGHDSEQPLPPYLIDWQIVNDGSLEELLDRVDEAMCETGL